MARKRWRTLPLILITFALSSILLVACIRPGTVATTTGNAAPAAPACSSGTTVKTSTNNFEQTCIALKKGDTLTVAQDQTSYHVLDFGQWNGSTAQPETPSGAPKLKDLTLQSASVRIGPFTTAGTYHIYCTVHPGMNLTVMVS